MVGVPGKYKGCETCRLRRVKCDNARPYCRKCIDSDRQCAGYERETVFIIGTQEDGGRCSSHPPRVIKPKKPREGSSSGSRRKSATSSPGSSSAPSPPSKSTTSYQKQTPFELLPVPVMPLQPAWEDTIMLLNGGLPYATTIAILNAPIHALNRHEAGAPGASSAFVFSPLPPYIPADVRPMALGHAFQLRSQCMMHLASPTGSVDGITDSNFCLLLYEHNASSSTSTLSWDKPEIRAHGVRRQGPSRFTVFPAHHFFVRVFRPTAIFSALLNRSATFLADADWVTGPWEAHPKAPIDQLLDIVARVPEILGHVDQITPQDPTMARYMMAQESLVTCLQIEHALDQYGGVGRLDSGLSYWINPGAIEAQIPFPDTFAFADGATALMFVTYWTTLVLLYPCIESLQTAVYEPVYDGFPNMFHLPHIADPSKYSAKTVMVLAANVCRSLDFVLQSTVQPDMLVVPLFIVESYFHHINATMGGAGHELLWCSGFRSRLSGRGQVISNMVQSRQWVDVAQY